jgi:hypothetical protein
MTGPAASRVKDTATDVSSLFMKISFMVCLFSLAVGLSTSVPLSYFPLKAVKTVSYIYFLVNRA